MALLSVEHYSDRQSRALQRIKEKMTASAHRAVTQYGRVRKHERKEFQGMVLVRLASTEPVETSPDDLPSFQAWAYDISQGGIAFVAPDIVPQELVEIGLKRPGGGVRWMPGRIVRSRPIPEEEFIDYGVAFRRTAT